MNNLAKRLLEISPPAVNDTGNIPVTGGDLSNEATCFALSGVTGGAGVTSLCVQLAYDLVLKAEDKASLKDREDKPQVCLIDLDFENGSCAHYLDIKPGLHMDDLCCEPDRMDKALLGALTSTHKSGIKLIAARNSLMGNSDVNPEIVLNILDIASQAYDYMILDVPRIWQPWTHAAIAASHNFGLLTELTIPSLHMTRAKLQYLNSHMANNSHIDLLLSKYERRSFRNSLRVDDAEQTLGRELFAKISNDPDIVREAINWGIPVGTVRSDSRYVKDCRALIELWLERNNQSKSAVL